MSNLLTPEVLDVGVIDRDVSQDLYEYNAQVRDDLADAPAPLWSGTLEHCADLTEFTD